jgi:transcription elongation GreA/GreB family factor
MDQKEKIDYKKQLKAFCLALISERIGFGRKAMENAQEAANSEEKSSAGDKYETSRAMSHLEKDMNARQLQQNLVELSRLQLVDPEIIFNKVTTGCIIDCGQIRFFVAAGLGKQKFGDQVIFLLSPQAPLAAKLMNKTAGYCFIFNDQDLIITEVY